MEIYTMTTRPSMPLTLACAPSASVLVAAPAWASTVVERAPFNATAPIMVPVLAAERAPASQVHQVSVQAELGDLALAGGNGNTSSGFKGSKVSIKRYTDGASGVPPRGRPV